MAEVLEEDGRGKLPVPEQLSQDRTNESIPVHEGTALCMCDTATPRGIPPWTDGRDIKTRTDMPDEEIEFSAESEPHIPGEGMNDITSVGGNDVDVTNNVASQSQPHTGSAGDQDRQRAHGEKVVVRLEIDIPWDGIVPDTEPSGNGKDPIDSSLDNEADHRLDSGDKHLDSYQSGHLPDKKNRLNHVHAVS